MIGNETKDKDWVFISNDTLAYFINFISNLLLRYFMAFSFVGLTSCLTTYLSSPELFKWVADCFGINTDALTILESLKAQELRVKELEDLVNRKQEEIHDLNIKLKEANSETRGILEGAKKIDNSNQSINWWNLILTTVFVTAAVSGVVFTAMYFTDLTWLPYLSTEVKTGATSTNEIVKASTKEIFTKLADVSIDNNTKLDNINNGVNLNNLKVDILTENVRNIIKILIKKND